MPNGEHGGGDCRTCEGCGRPIETLAQGAYGCATPGCRGNYSGGGDDPSHPEHREFFRTGVALPAEGRSVLAKRPTLDIAPLFNARLEAALVGTGWAAYLGGSVLRRGSGRDLDFVLMPRIRAAAPVGSLRAALSALGPEVVPWDKGAETEAQGAVYQVEGFLLDVACVETRAWMPR